MLIITLSCIAPGHDGGLSVLVWLGPAPNQTAIGPVCKLLTHITALIRGGDDGTPGIPLQPMFTAR